jgi:hypothetical protein
VDLSGQDLDNVARTIIAEAGQNGTPAAMADGATHYYAPAAQAQNNASDPAHNPLVPGFAKGDSIADIEGHRFYAPNGAVTADKIAALGGSTGPGTAPPFSGRSVSSSQPGGQPAGSAGPATG